MQAHIASLSESEIRIESTNLMKGVAHNELKFTMITLATESYMHGSCAGQKDRVLLAQAHHILIKHLTSYLIWRKLQSHSSSQILSQEKSGSGLGTR